MKGLKKIWYGFRTLLVDARIYLSRSQGWMSAMNSGMIVFLFLGRLKDAEVVNFELDKFFIIVYGGILVIMILWGWIDEKLGIYAEDAERQLTPDRNPVMAEIREGIKRIEEKVDRLEREVEGN